MTALILTVLLTTMPQHYLGASAATVSGYGLARVCHVSKTDALILGASAGIGTDLAFQAGELHAGHAWDWSRTGAAACGAVTTALTCWQPRLGEHIALIAVPALVVGAFSDTRSAPQLVAQTALGSLLLMPLALEADPRNRTALERQAVVTFAVGVAAVALGGTGGQ